MLKYSTISSKCCNCKKEEMLEFMKTTDKPFKYTYGFKYRRPTTYLVQISREEAINHLMNDCLCDVEETEKYIDINSYSSNDMW